MSSFDEWWQEYGSGLPPQLGEDQESHAERVARLAWHEGRRQAFKEASGVVRRYERENCHPVTPEAMLVSRVRSEILKKEVES